MSQQRRNTGEVRKRSSVPWKNRFPLDPFEDRGFSLTLTTPPSRLARRMSSPPPNTIPHHPTSHPCLLLELPVFPVRFRRSKATPLDSPMQGHTDEARGRFTSQHAHVVPGGVHAARVFGMGWGEAETKSKPSRCPALANFCYPSQAARPSLAFSWAGGARHQTTWQRTSDGRCPLVPGVPDAEHSSLRLPWSRRLSWRGRPGNKVEDSLPVNQRIRTHRAYYVQPRSAFARAPHLIHPKIQDQGQCGGGVPGPVCLPRPLWHLLLGRRECAHSPYPTLRRRVSPVSLSYDEPGVIFAEVAALFFSSLTPSHTPPLPYSLLTVLPPLGFFCPPSVRSHTPLPTRLHTRHLPSQR